MDKITDTRKQMSTAVIWCLCVTLVVNYWTTVSDVLPACCITLWGVSFVFCICIICIQYTLHTYYMCFYLLLLCVLHLVLLIRERCNNVCRDSLIYIKKNNILKHSSRPVLPLWNKLQYQWVKTHKHPQKPRDTHPDTHSLPMQTHRHPQAHTYTHTTSFLSIVMFRNHHKCQYRV